ncbi:MAG: DUF4783 domain-containing protein [Mucilaginibacter polytrichastri]|nr:DUF4783 domain-containing protein [Mucilaginibacter polytrichastri]
MKLLYLLILLVFPARTVLSDDPAEKIASLFKNGDAESLAAMLDQSVRLTILGEENVYFKGQAQAVIEKFFKTHKPSAAKVLHRVETNPELHFAVISLQAEGDQFRVSVQMRAEQSAYLITEISIEKGRD